DYLVRFVFPKLREKLLAYRIHFVDVDLRWGVTSDQDSVAACCEIVDQCRPYFLCMIGGRYGFVPPGKNYSITAEEVYYGVLNRQPKDRGFAHFYFRDDAITDAITETFPGEFREPKGSENQKKLTNFKKEIIAAGLQPFTYPAQWDDKNRRLTGLQELGDRVYEDLLNSIRSDPRLRDRFKDDYAAQPDEFDEENAAMEMFAEVLSERFIPGSREPVLAELLAYVSGSSDGGYICLTGVSGSGKSALLAHLSRHSALNSRRSILLIRHFVDASPRSSNIFHTVRRFCHELKTACPDIAIDIPDDPERLPITFLQFLLQACARKRVVILLDAVNKFDPASYSAVLHWLPKQLPANARIILSAPDYSALMGIMAHELQLKPLTKKDSRTIIEQFLARYHKRFALEQYDALQTKTDANIPLYIMVALEELRSLGIYEEITQRIIDLPPTTHELFIWILKRLENDDGFRDKTGQLVGRELVPRFSALLGASRNGLSQSELADLLSPADAGTNALIASDAEGNLAALLRLLRPYLMYRGDLLDFSHDEFKSAAVSSQLETHEQCKTAHAQLADYFAGIGLDHLGIRMPNIRVVDELPWQLAQAENWKWLYDLLCEPAFIEYAYLIDRFSIMSYWSKVEQHTSLRMVNGYNRNSLQEGVLVSSQIDTMASLLMNAGHLAEAKSLLDQLRLVAGMLTSDKRGYAILLGRLGLIARAQDRLDEALSLFKQQEQIARKLEDWQIVSVALGNQAIIFSDRADHVTAMHLHKEEEQICRRVNDIEGLAACLGNQGVILMAKSDLKGAMAMFKEEERVSREFDIKNQLQLSLGNQSIILTAWGHIDEAMAALVESENICREINMPDGVARSLFNQGFVKGVHMDALDEGARLMEKACQIADEHGLKLLAREFEERLAKFAAIVDMDGATRERAKKTDAKALKLGEKGKSLW
ncbi:MAG: AAA family ATPase, partial [Anaerolineales bacterium]